jgi:hypothetical protein
LAAVAVARAGWGREVIPLDARSLAVGIIRWKVDELKLGKVSSRFVAAVVALVAYYYVAYYYLEGLGYTFWLAQLVVPVALVLTAVYYLIRVIEDKWMEFLHLLKSSGRLVVAVGLLILSRFLFSL